MKIIWNKENLELIKKLEYLMSEASEIGLKFGIDNIHDKDKWKELIVSSKLNDTVFTSASGEFPGADSRSNDTNNPREYKGEELKTESAKERFLESVVDENSTSTFAGSMTYNGAGGTGDDLGKKSRKTVISYRGIEHFHHTWFRSVLVSIARVYTDYVTGDDGLMKRVIKEETGTKYSSTNGNGVGVHYENGRVREGEGKVVYLNDIRK